MKKLQIKRGPKAGLPILEQGEFGYALDTNELYIGVLAEPTSPNDNVLVNELTDLSAYSTTSQMNSAIDAAALALGTNYAVANIAARDNLEDLVVGDMVFVTDDGDTKWAQYKVTGIGPVVFTKIMDQDALINAIDGPGIKAAYESNADTNAFTDALQTKLTTTDVFDDAGTYANLRAQGTTKGDVGLGNVTNDAQVKKATTSTDGYIPKWDGTTGDSIVDGYEVLTSLDFDPGTSYNLPGGRYFSNESFNGIVQDHFYVGRFDLAVAVNLNTVLNVDLSTATRLQFYVGETLYADVSNEAGVLYQIGAVSGFIAPMPPEPNSVSKIYPDPATSALIPSVNNLNNIPSITSIVVNATGEGDVTTSLARADAIITAIDAINKEDVGLGSVENYAVASQAEAQAGSVNNKYMTPLRTSEAIAELVDFDFGLFLPLEDPFGTPGPQIAIAETGNAGFFGQVSQEDFGRTMEQVMSDLGIVDGTAQNTNDGLLKFIHRGKIKFINRRPIRHSITWNHIHSQLSASGGQGVYGGRTLTFGGHSYKVRLMRGWGQVSANTDNTFAPPNYETGPLFTLSFTSGSGGNSGVNWPTNTSGWSAESPNEWNTLIFPIASATQSQTDDVPNWASYSNDDLQVASGNGRATWTQETVNTNTSNRAPRGYGLAGTSNLGSGNSSSNLGLRLVFEHIPAE